MNNVTSTWNMQNCRVRFYMYYIRFCSIVGAKSVLHIAGIGNTHVESRDIWVWREHGAYRFQFCWRLSSYASNTEMSYSCSNWKPLFAWTGVYSTMVCSCIWYLGWGLLKPPSLISPPVKFWILQKYPLDFLHHIHIGQVSPQPNCNGICPIWTW